MKKLYAVWIKIDETIPWIELKGDYFTRKEANNAAIKILKHVKIKIVKISRKKKVKMKALM